MQAGCWFRISGDAPDLGLSPTAVGTRYLEDNDPACDPDVNPPATMKERLRRRFGRACIAPWSGRVGFPSITEAWNGAIFASRFGEAGSMVVFGGGHNDYFGSDVHAFDLASREWRRLTTGFTTGRRDEYGQGAFYEGAVYPDSSPLPPHTYHYIQYDDVGNDLLLLKGQKELGPHVKAAAIPHMFNLDTLRWRRGPEHPSAILDSGGFSTWDSKRRILWGHSGDDRDGNDFVGFAPDGENPDGTFGEWREHVRGKLRGEANHNAMQIHPSGGPILFSLHARDALAMLDPEHPGAALAQITSTGPKPGIHEFAALEYSLGLQSFVYYSATDAAVVYGIDLRDEAIWRVLGSQSSRDPVKDAAKRTRHRINLEHTFGRFRVAHYDVADLAILVRHVDSPVYAMRLQ